MKGFELLIANKQFQKLIERKDIDLPIIDAMVIKFTYFLVDQLNGPFVLHCSYSGLPPMLDRWATLLYQLR